MQLIIYRGPYPVLSIFESLRENIFEFERKTIMQKIVIFIEPTDKAFEKPVKIGNLFMNRFAIDEDASTEILKIFELCKRPAITAAGWQKLFADKGTDDFIVTRN